MLSRFVAAIGNIHIRHLKTTHLEQWFYGPDGVMSPHTTREGRPRDPVAPSTSRAR